VVTFINSINQIPMSTKLLSALCTTEAPRSGQAGF